MNWYFDRLSVHPHIRGAYGYLSLLEWEAKRFIPTYVGHTICLRPRSKSCSVHPHIRGAYSGKIKAPKYVIGSSPHTWGILFMSRSRFSVLRFIPTYVGHTRGRPGGFWR